MAQNGAGLWRAPCTHGNAATPTEVQFRRPCKAANAAATASDSGRYGKGRRARAGFDTEGAGGLMVRSGECIPRSICRARTSRDRAEGERPSAAKFRGQPHLRPLTYEAMAALCNYALPSVPR